MKVLEQLYEGKAKKVFKTDDDSLYLIRYKDDATAFNGAKKGSITDKGIMNNAITTLLFEALGKAGIAHHLVQKLNEREHRPDRLARQRERQPGLFAGRPHPERFRQGDGQLLAQLHLSGRGGPRAPRGRPAHPRP